MKMNGDHECVNLMTWVLIKLKVFLLFNLLLLSQIYNQIYAFQSAAFIPSLVIKSYIICVNCEVYVIFVLLHQL